MTDVVVEVVLTVVVVVGMVVGIELVDVTLEVCWNVIGWFAMVTVPVRVDPVVFLSTVKVTVPLPVPELPEVMWIHGALLPAVHGHVLDVVTATVNEPPFG